MNESTSKINSSSDQSGIGWLKLFVIIAVATTVATLIGVWAVSTYMFPKELKPVTLSEKEEKVLNEKLARLDSAKASPLKPERYEESASRREIVLNEKELNSLIAKNTDLAKNLAIDLSKNLASAKLLVPLEEDFPFLGGKTLKVIAGLEVAYAEGRPVVALKGVSVWGVPLPNAWLGDMKNVDLVKEFGDEGGFWKAFAAGIDDMEIREGSVRIRLKE